MLADAMLPVPASLMTLLAGLAPSFTAPSFRTSCGLACGFLAPTGKRTVCGMLAGASLSQLWPHDRAHRFFSRARRRADDLGLAVARLVAALLVPAGQPVTVAIDDTLFTRRGKKVWAASWFHADLRWLADRIRERDLAATTCTSTSTTTPTPTRYATREPSGHCLCVWRCQPSGCARGQPGLAFRASRRA
jgi:hypothetical protein